MVWGEEPPIFSIGYDPPKSPHDSGFTILFDDAPDPGDVTEDDPCITWVCLHCVINDHPEIGPGLDIARQHLVAELDENGDWIVGDVSRLGDAES